MLKVCKHLYCEQQTQFIGCYNAGDRATSRASHGSVRYGDAPITVRVCMCTCVRADLILSGLDKRDLLSLHRLSCWSLEEARGVSNETGSVYKQPL